MQAVPGSSPDNRVTAGALLRGWRVRHGLSQLGLSVETGVSTRHISRIETGRAHPSRAMILRLSSHLGIPPRDRSRILWAAGYAPAYRQTPLDQPALWPAHDAIDRVLRAHEPFPALVFTTSWRLVSANRPLWWLLEGVPEHLLRPPINMMRVALHPEGVGTRVRNQAAWHHHLRERLRRQVATTGDPSLAELAREIGSYPSPDRHADQRPRPDEMFATLRFHHHGQDLDFVSTLATFGTQLDLTPAELIIESFYPADTRTASAMAKHAISWDTTQPAIKASRHRPG